LPEATIEAVVRRSEDAACESARASAGSVGSIVYLAEWVARLLADGRWEALEQLLSIGRRDHHLASEQLAVLVETLEEKVRGLADVLSLELPQATDYRELLVTAQARLADVAADAAAEIVRHEQRDLALTPGASLAEEMRSLGAAANRIAGGPAKSGPRHAAAPVAPGPVTPGPPAGTDGPAARHPPALSAEAHRGLLGQLASAVAACRLSRCPLSLLLVELARADELVLMHGMERFHQSRSALEGACRGVDHPQRVCIPYGEAGFAVVLLGCDRQRAVRLGNQLAERTGSDPLDGGAEKRSVAAIGLGAATVGMPPKNFPPKDLLVAANRCLYGSHASGGGIVKSIEIY
jgi:hypothetical protein